MAWLIAPWNARRAASNRSWVVGRSGSTDSSGSLGSESIASRSESWRGTPGSTSTGAVGGAVGRNPIGLLIPCHRVIAGDGTLGGYGGDWWGTREAMLGVKRTLLELEGVQLPAGHFLD